MKNEFKKLGAIHAHSSSLHNNKSKRTKKNESGLNVDLVESDDDEPFTLKTSKKDGVKKHEIVVKHELPPSSYSSSTSSSSIRGMKLSEENEILAKVFNILLIYLIL